MIVDLKQNDEKGEPSWLHEPLPSDAITTPGNKTTVSTSPSSSTSKSWEEEKKNAFEDISRDSSQTKKSRVSAGTTGSRPVVIDIQPQPLDDEICNCCGCHLDLVLMGFQVFHFLGGLTALASISANFYVFTDMTLQDDIREVILRIYALLFAFITILVETDMDVFMQYFTLFQSWFLRGLWYAFVGILTIRMDSSIGAGENVIGFAMIAFGVAYSIMALLRIKKLKSRHELSWNRYRNRGYQSIR